MRKVSLRLLNEARKAGINPSTVNKITDAEFKAITVAAELSRSPISFGRKVCDAVESLVATSSGVRSMPVKVAEEREHKCRNECPVGAFVVTKNGSPVCLRCKCSGKFLRAKWRDPTQFCPLTVEQRAWDAYRPEGT